MNLCIAQLTDIHIGFDRASAREANVVRLEAALARLGEDGVRPDLLLLTGDLTEHGDDASFACLVAALEPRGIPVWPIPGNHDSREGLLRAFPQVRATDGFVQYAIDLPGFRVLMLDTLDFGRHGGAFCEVRARWLADQLAQAPAVPTLIAMHHPPFASGIQWMDVDADADWVARFAETIAGHDQIVGIICGHVHRATTTLWQGVQTTICPSTAPATGLNFDPIDGDHPDGRAMISDETPGFALHRWDGKTLLTHVLTAGPTRTLARHDGRMTALLRDMAAERG